MLRSGIDRAFRALTHIVKISRNVKQGMVLLLDMLIVVLSMAVAYGYPVTDGAGPPGSVEAFCAVITLLASASIFLRMGLYRAIIRFMGQQAIWTIIQAVSYSTLALGATVFFTQADVPRSMPFVYWAVAMCGIGGSRLVVRASYQARLRSCSKTC